MLTNYYFLKNNNLSLHKVTQQIETHHRERLFNFWIGVFPQLFEKIIYKTFWAIEF